MKQRDYCSSFNVGRKSDQQICWPLLNIFVKHLFKWGTVSAFFSYFFYLLFFVLSTDVYYFISLNLLSMKLLWNCQPWRFPVIQLQKLSVPPKQPVGPAVSETAQHCMSQKLNQIKLYGETNEARPIQPDRKQHTSCRRGHWNEWGVSSSATPQKGEFDTAVMSTCIIKHISLCSAASSAELKCLHLYIVCYTIVKYLWSSWF